MMLASALEDTRTPCHEPYILGGTNAEHARLVRQAALLAPTTVALFCAAGIGPGQRVLDIGSGMGDVAMLAGKLVGPGGEVVSIDRDGAALAKGRQRAATAGLHRVRFVEADIAQVPEMAPFDAVVGRLVLNFQRDPVAIVRTLAGLVRPGGLVVFQEGSWASMIPQSAHLKLRATCTAIMLEAFHRGGTQGRDMGTKLSSTFRNAGLPAPQLRLEMPIGHDTETRRWLHDLFLTLQPKCEHYGISLAPLGNLATLAERLDAELDEAGAFACCVCLIGAWSRRPVP